jgi:hypothetical protein
MTTTVYNVNKQIQSKNYVIDGDADRVIEGDFFNQLKNMLTQSEDNDSINDVNEDNCCLLTKEPLKNIHINLVCGHKFNYVPIYREVIAQKTIGLSPNGYYTSNSLKRNEIKCPYCRNVQDKLLPYLEYDGVKKMVGVNYPTKMSMTSQPCMYTYSASSKKGKKSACKECAVEYYNGTYVCKKHYDACVTSPPPVTVTSAEKKDETTEHTEQTKCGAILRYGKNKGNPCSNHSTCRVHSNCKNKIVVE